MPKDLTDVDVFTSPIPVPVDSDTRNAASVETPFQGLANRTYANQQDIIGNTADIATNTAGVATNDGRLDDIEAQISSEEWVYTSPKSRVLTFTSAVFSAGDMYTAGDQPGWRRAGLLIQSTADSRAVRLPINRLVPYGSTITRIRCRVNPGVGRGVGDRISLQLIEYASLMAGSTAQTIIFDVEDDGGTLDQAIDSGVIAYAVTGAAADISLTSGNNASANDDTCSALEITFNDPGPRNF